MRRYRIRWGRISRWYQGNEQEGGLKAAAQRELQAHILIILSRTAGSAAGNQIDGSGAIRPSFRGHY